MRLKVTKARPARTPIEVCISVSLANLKIFSSGAPLPSHWIDTLISVSDTRSPVHPEDFRSAKPRIGINIPFHGYEPTEWIKKYLEEFVATLKKLQQATACEFTYFVHYDSEVLIAALIKDQGLAIALVNTNAAQLPDEYAKMDLHIGGMLHSCIIATAAGTPCIGLAYDEKHFGFFELMERGEYCLRANPINFDVLLQKSLEILQNATREQFKINARRRELMAKFLQTLNSIAA